MAPFVRLSRFLYDRTAYYRHAYARRNPHPAVNLTRDSIVLVCSTWDIERERKVTVTINIGRLG